MKILVVGAGAVGGYFGGKLAQAGNPVVFVARGKNLIALQQKPLVVESIGGDFSVPVTATYQVPKGMAFDLVLLCVKTYQMRGLLPLLQPAFTEKTLVISLQNGLFAHLPLVNEFGEARVATGVIYLGAAMTEPGQVRHVAAGKILVGELNGKSSERLNAVVQVFRQAGVEAAQDADIQARKWEKLIWNVGFNGPTALAGLTVGDLLQRPEQRRLALNLMQEAMLIAENNGVTLDPDLPTKIITYSEKDLAPIETSMLCDRRRHQPLEWDIFQGFISNEGARLSIPTPANDLVGSLLRALSPKD